MEDCDSRIRERESPIPRNQTCDKDAEESSRIAASERGVGREVERGGKGERGEEREERSDGGGNEGDGERGGETGDDFLVSQESAERGLKIGMQMSGEEEGED